MLVAGCWRCWYGVGALGNCCPACCCWPGKVKLGVCERDGCGCCGEPSKPRLAGTTLGGGWKAWVGKPGFGVAFVLLFAKPWANWEFMSKEGLLYMAAGLMGPEAD